MMEQERLIAETSLADVLAAEPVLSFLPQMQRELPQGRVYLVGGAVRDFLLRRPNKDFDFVVAGAANAELSAWLAAHGRVDLVGRNFGVYKFVPKNFSAQAVEMIDVALPRREHASADSRGGSRDFAVQSDANLPIEDDLSRRDFTINALAYDLRTKKIIDPHGGQKDLAAQTLRAVGDPAARFSEDLSRILRAIRQATQLNFEIEAETWTALRALAPQLNDRRDNGRGQEEYVVSREMSGTEIAKAFAADPARALKLLADSGVLGVLLPEIAAALADKNFFVPLSTSDRVCPTYVFSLLLRETPPELVAGLLQRSGLTALPGAHPARVRENDVAWLVAKLQDQTTDFNALASSDIEKYFRNDRGDLFIRALEALGQPGKIEVVKQRLNKIETIWPTERGVGIPKLVSGADVLALGLEPGPRVRKLLDQVRDAQLEGRVLDRDQALSMLKNLTANGY